MYYTYIHARMRLHPSDSEQLEENTEGDNGALFAKIGEKELVHFGNSGLLGHTCH